MPLQKNGKNAPMRLIPLLTNYFTRGVFMHPLIKKHLSIFQSQALVSAFSVLLSFIMLLNAIGYYPLFKIKQWQVHEEMKSLIRSSLPDDKLKCVTVSVNEEYKIHWEWEWEDEQEFTYEGNLYDVIRTSMEGNTTHYYCIQDTQETNLFAQLDQEVERKMDDKGNPLQQTAKKMMKIFSYLIHTSDDQTTMGNQLAFNHYFDIHHCIYQYDFFNSVTPPPKRFA